MISFLIAAACVAFVLSLPISKTGAGQTLRRWAGVLFLLALAPALFMGLLGSMGSTAIPAASSGGDDFFGKTLGLLILCPLAYWILEFRKRSSPKSRDPWADYVDRKAAGKKVVDPKAARPVPPGRTFGPFGGSP